MKRSWLLELGLGLLATALGSFFLWRSVSEGDGLPWAVDLLTGAAAFAGLVLFRRSHPIALTLVLIPAGIAFGMPMGATPIALFAVGLHRPASVAIALTALHALLVGGTYYLALGMTGEYVEVVTFLILLHATLMAIAMLVRAHRLLVHSWAERARQAEEGQRLRIDQARLAERERIAPEMHDVLAHRISLLAVHAGALEVRPDAPAEEREAAGLIRQKAYEALEDLRGVVHMLRDPAVDRPQPTMADVPTLVEESRGTGTSVNLDMATVGPVPATAGRHAYRIVQETLTNARKHAPGASVRVSVTGNADDGLGIEVVSGLAPRSAGGRRGVGLDAAGGVPLPGSGSGLTGIGERVQLAGGKLQHGPTPTGEFRVRAWLPWRA